VGDDDRELDYLAANVADWSQRADDQREAGRRNWGKPEPTWGIFGVPESVVRMLPDAPAGLRVVELGCGTAYVSSWLARRGARPIAIDPTPSQLRIAADLQVEFDLPFPLVRAVGESLPFADDSFDFAISEYGAAIWADPYRWIPEAARVLRPGGELVFLGNSLVLMLCVPDEDDGVASTQLLRPLRGMHRFDWPEPVSTEFHLPHGEWISLFRRCGFDVLELHELHPEEGAMTRYGFVTYEWARQWPHEEVWRVRLSR
jgi:SAM-dependent methyltransferase